MVYYAHDLLMYLPNHNKIQEETTANMGHQLHGLKFSVATTDFHHSDFTEAIYELNVGRRRTSVD